MKILRRAGLEPAIFRRHCEDCPATLAGMIAAYNCKGRTIVNAVLAVSKINKCE